MISDAIDEVRAVMRLIDWDDYKPHVKEAFETLVRSAVVASWQTIDTAPRDGTVILLTRNIPFVGGYSASRTNLVKSFYWDKDAWCWDTTFWMDGENGPTHWKPLLKLPEPK